MRWNKNSSNWRPKLAKADPSNIFRENLAGLIEQLHKAEQLRDGKHMELAEAQLKKRSTEAALNEVRKKIAMVKDYRPGEPAKQRPNYLPPAMVGMGGQHWDLRKNQDADWMEAEPAPTPEQLAALPSLKDLEEAEREAISQDYQASFKIGALENLKGDAQKAVTKIQRAIEDCISQIVLPEIHPLIDKTRAAQTEFVKHQVVLRLLADRFRNRFGKDIGPVADASLFLDRAINIEDWNWSSHPAAVKWREAIDRLNTDPMALLPEFK